MTAYIMTRSRIPNLLKIVPRWIDQSIPVVLVTERQELEEHKDLIRREGWLYKVKAIAPKAEDRGIGYKRRFAVNHAHTNGLASIIMSDDDMRPANGSDMRWLLTEAMKQTVLGIGATRSLHDRNSKGWTSKIHGPMLCPGGWGMQMFALNIENTVHIGNFDPKLDCWGEDAELMRHGIAKVGMPWLVHCDVKCEPIGVRYDPGGINSLITDGTRMLREIRCREIIHERWPEYTTPAEKKPMMRWQKMMDDYIPNWRERSAMHGGSWA
jgi:hypothetical protein